MAVTKMPADLQKLADERKKQIDQNIDTMKDFSSYAEIFDVLQADTKKTKVSLLTEEEQAKLTAGDKSIRLPKLPKLAVAGILKKHFDFCLFDEEETSRLAMYIPMEGIYTQNYKLIKKIISYVEPSLTENQAETVIYFISNRTEVKTPVKSRFLIPVANGIYNLKKHELMPFSPDYVFTTKIATNYVENPIPPNIDGWNVDDWLDELACQDEQIVKLMWQVISDSCNGNYSRRKAIFLVGNLAGNNGKGTFQELITNLVGAENVGHLKVTEFDKRFSLSRLAGKSVCIGDDTPANVFIKDSSNFNSVVTGDHVTIEYKGKDSYSLQLTCGVIQSCNGMPNFHNKGGTMRRILIIPFNAHFGDSKKSDNWNIKDDYIKRQDVLEYVLYRALQLDFDKFSEPDASSKALKQFELDNDPIISFKQDFFEQNEIERIPTYYLYGFYAKYCTRNHYTAVSSGKFIRQFMERSPEFEKKFVKVSSADKEIFDELNKSFEVSNYENVPLVGKVYSSIVKK